MVSSTLRRFLSTTNSGEPPYMVELGAHKVDYKDVQIPYLRDDKRWEMYQKHVSDPSLYTVEKLSLEYGASIDRTNAVLYLMAKRAEMHEKLGVTNLSDKHKEMYDKHVSDPAVFTVEALSEETGIDRSQVTQILSNLSEHFSRMATLDASKEHMESVMATFETAGIDTTFKEVANVGKLSQRYKPRLFGDDEEEEVKAELKTLIERDTRAKVEPSVDEFIARVRKEGVAPVEPANLANVSTDTLSRWKFAYRDSSRIQTQPTMVRTRRGGWRMSTPLEEAGRSWSRSPTFLDGEIHKHKWGPFLDPDGDEREAAMIASKKRAAVEARKKAKDVKA